MFLTVSESTPLSMLPVFLLCRGSHFGEELKKSVGELVDVQDASCCRLWFDYQRVFHMLIPAHYA